MKWIVACICTLLYSVSFGQHNFQVLIEDAETKEPLIGATARLEGTSKGGVTAIDGKLTITEISAGSYVMVFSYLGYTSRRDTVDFPNSLPQPYVVQLQSAVEEMESIVVSATRSTRTIEDIPTRVEAITLEELGEKSMMNSSNISMVLRESTGIQIQQTSAISGNQSLRIQGLDGRYTQLLKDGFPLFGGFSGGLSIMQIPPLDLYQVEVIKGSASTLYGGGAIAGLVNLVSKRPVLDKPELSIMYTQTHVGGSTGNVFASKREEKLGYTVYVSAYNQELYDPNSDDFTDIPEVQSISVNPKLFWYPNKKTILWFGLNSSFEDRLGGDVQVINSKADSTHTFTERNESRRANSQFSLEKQIGSNRFFNLRNSVSYFNRGVDIPDYSFGGEQLSTYSEANYSIAGERSEWIMGMNFISDRFTEETFQFGPLRNYELLTAGSFLQHTYNVNDKYTLESGFRSDYNFEHGVFLLPRVSVLYNLNHHWSFRAGGGMGYKLPTIFIEDAEVRSFRNINPVDVSSIVPENSLGGNFDFNFKTILGDKVSFSYNQLFFYTRLDNSLLLMPNTVGRYDISNADGLVDTRGLESNIKFGMGDFRLFLQYAFIDARLNYNNINDQKPLTPKHNAGGVLMYEQENKWRIGYESYYVGQQIRSDFSKTRDYWMMGFLVQRQIGKIGVFVNFENFLDARQSRYQDMVLPPHSDPTFTEVWAPTDGFVGSIGIIWKPFSNEEDE